MAQVAMTVRTDANLKEVFTNLCEEFGMSANTAMNIFMRAVMETKSIPFPIAKRRDMEAEHLIILGQWFTCLQRLPHRQRESRSHCKVSKLIRVVDV